MCQTVCFVTFDCFVGRNSDISCSLEHRTDKVSIASEVLNRSDQKTGFTNSSLMCASPFDEEKQISLAIPFSAKILSLSEGHLFENVFILLTLAMKAWTVRIKILSQSRFSCGVQFRMKQLNYF